MWIGHHDEASVSGANPDPDPGVVPGPAPGLRRDPDPDEPIEDLVARVRERVSAVEAQAGTRRDRARSARWMQRLRSAPVHRAEWSGRWVNIGLLVVAIVVVSLVVLLRISKGADDTAVVAAGTTTESSVADLTMGTVSRTSAPFDQSAPNAAAMVPKAWRSRCRFAPALRSRAAHAWVCAVIPDVSVEITAFTNHADARAMLRVARSSLRTRLTQCTAVEGQPVAWARHSDPDAEVGVFDCGTTQRGAELVWTVAATDVVVRAVRNDGDVQQLFDWWNSLNRTASPL